MVVGSGRTPLPAFRIAPVGPLFYPFGKTEGEIACAI